MLGNNKTVQRGVLLFIIIATLPCYLLGLAIWASAPQTRNVSITQTSAADDNPNGSATWTPLGFNRTTTPSGLPTLNATATNINPLAPTPGQFQPILRTPIPTAFIPPIDTLAPTITPSNDADRDGIVDSQDQCPTIPGIALFQGCNDTDNDGIPDNRDACVATGGVPQNNGCPLPTATPIVDSDGDGISDTTDQCPNQAGVASNGGCPAPTDTDNDGVLDSADQCVNQAGPASNNGCPVAAVDTDGDGIADTQDLCPAQAGTPLTQGCPEDSDSDGFNDNVDQCISDPGPNNGCP